MRTRGALLAVVLLVFMAGCLSVTAEVTVDGDGNVAMDTEMVFDAETVSLLELQIIDEDYDSVGEYLIDEFQSGEQEDIGDDFDEFDGVEYDYEERSDGSLAIMVSSDPTDPATIDGIEVELSDDQAEFTNTDGIQEGDLGDDSEFDVSQIELAFVVNMPGELTDHNGEQVDDTTVRWTVEDHAGTEELTASSEVDDDAGSSDGIPGFTAGLAIAAIALGLAAYAGRHR